VALREDRPDHVRLAITGRADDPPSTRSPDGHRPQGHGHASGSGPAGDARLWWQLGALCVAGRALGRV